MDQKNNILLDISFHRHGCEYVFKNFTVPLMCRSENNSCYIWIEWTQKVNMRGFIIKTSTFRCQEPKWSNIKLGAINSSNSRMKQKSHFMEEFWYWTYIWRRREISATNLKFPLKLCGCVGHKIFTSNHRYLRLYNEKAQNKISSPWVGHLFQHVQDLKNYPNGTRRVFTSSYWRKSSRLCM